MLVATARPTAVEPLALPPLPEPQAPAAPAEPAQAPDQANVGTACGVTGNLGTPISLDFKDGDLQDIFRLFSDISGLNVVVNPGVTGKVTLKLNEVPWGRALELILKTNGLGCVLEENVIRIAKITDLQREEVDRRKLQEEKELAGDLVTHTQRISYAKASDLSAVLKNAKAVSSRGEVNVDERTNTIIMRDLPSYVQKARGLIGELDTATPQVEIEARIVVTTRNFTRDLGIQWGFGAAAIPQFGNTTSKTFPNAIVLNGGAVPGELGIPADNIGPGGALFGVRDRHRRPRLRRQPARERLQHRHRHLDGQHPGQLQPRRGADGARAAGPRAPAVDAEGDDAEQQVGRDQAGRPDPDPDAGEQHGDRAVQGRGADPQGHPADHRRGHRDPGARGGEQLPGLREPGERHPARSTRSPRRRSSS